MDFYLTPTSLSGGQTATYAYNGLGDRLSQNGVNYTLDLNSGLTQVLNDGTNQYLYGVGRIAQVNTTTEYFLGDALGSVRQLTDSQGEVTRVNAYEPYGSVSQSAGSAQTSYGFAGEFTDPSGMVYLRARFYMPTDGRFLTRDTWDGDLYRPMSQNAWLYVYGNPINLTDPSGYDPYWCDGRSDEKLCIARWKVSNGRKLTSDDLKAIYNWFPDETLQLLQQEFGIKLPPGYQFRFAYESSDVLNRPFWDQEKNIGLSVWFAEMNLRKTSIFEASDGKCALYFFDNPSHTTHIDYSVYIADTAYTVYGFHPDDVAGTMIHEAVHAWQESLVRDNLDAYLAQFTTDPRTSLPWISAYKNGMERQAIDTEKWAHDVGVVQFSQLYLGNQTRYRASVASGWDPPINIPVTLVIR